jgi:hypothetical protein
MKEFHYNYFCRVYVGKSSIAGEGLFALHDLQPDVRALASHDEHMLEWTS